MQERASLAGLVRERFAAPLSITITGAIFLVSQASIAWVLHRGDAALALITLQTTFDPAAFDAVMSSLNHDQVSALKGHFLFDFLHPLWYGAFALLLLAWLFECNRVPGCFNALLWGAPLMALLDLLENLVHLPLITGHLQVSALPVAFAATCATLKWGIAAAFLVLSVALILRMLALGKTATRI
jgi:hypothetical protein